MGQNQNHSSPEFFSRSGPTRMLGLLIVIIVVVAAGYLIFHKSGPSFTTSQSANSSKSSIAGVMYLSPASQQVARSQTLSVSIYIDSKGQLVNAVQANLAYPADKLDFVSIDPNTSAFDVSAESTGADGSIKIARGHVGDLKGKLLVAKVNLTAKNATGTADITFAAGCAIVRSSDHVNILTNAISGHYTITTLEPNFIKKAA